MIKIETNKGDVKIEVDGDLLDIMADTTIIIQAIYDVLKSNNKSASAVFKKYLKNALNDDLPFGEKGE